MTLSWILSSVGFVLLFCLAHDTFAAEVAPASERVSAPPLAVPPLSAAAWDLNYDAARLRLRDGQFHDAAAAMSLLAESAPDVGRKRLALEQSWLALYWSRRGYQLELLSPQEHAATGARFRDRRTTDELAQLYLSGVAYGVGSGAALLPFTDPSSAAGGILPVLGLSALSVALVYQIDRKPLRYGGAQAITSGLFLGFEEGLVWVLWQDSRTTSNDFSEKTIALVLWGTSTAGAVAGGLIGQLHGITPGRASLVGSGAIWSALSVGFGVGALTEDSDKALLSAAVALNLGALGALFLGDSVQPSIGRVRFVDLGGVSGALVLGGLYAALADKSADGRGVLGAASLGMVVGLGTAWVLTASLPPDDPQRSPPSPLVPTVMPAGEAGGFVIGMAGAL